MKLVCICDRCNKEYSESDLITIRDYEPYPYGDQDTYGSFYTVTPCCRAAYEEDWRDGYDE